MSRLTSILARTVAAVAPSSVAVEFAGQRTRATSAFLEEDRALFEDQGISLDRAIRIPADDLTTEPAGGLDIVVDGVPHRISRSYRRGPVWLVGLERLQVRR